MLQLRTLGALDLVDHEGNSLHSVLAQPKRLALLTYLCVERPGEFKQRDTLLALFWPESPETAARHSLRQSLYKLRQSLGSSFLESRGTDQLRIERHSLGVDAVDFETLLGEGRRAEALELYRGDFLTGFHVEGAAGFERWHDSKRAQLKRAAARASWTLAKDQLQRGALQEAELTAVRAMHLDPAGETAALEFVAQVADEGAAAAASRLRSALETVLRVELDPTLDVDGPELPPRQRSAVGRPPPATDRDLGTTSPAGSVGITREPQAGRGWWPWAAVGVLALSLVALQTRGTLLQGSDELPVATDEVLPGVAVLPVSNISPDADDDYFAAGMHAELVNQLRRLSGLRVISGASMLRIRDAQLSLPDIAEQMDVEYLVTASARLAGERVRLLVQLVDGRTEVSLWGDEFDRTLSPEEVVDIQVEVAQGIAQALSIEILGGELEDAAHTGSVQALLLDMKGRDYARQALNAPLDERRQNLWQLAFDLFEQAIDLDPDFAPAHANLAVELLTWLEVDRGAGRLPAAEVDSLRRRARTAADRANELDASFPLSHAAVASVSYYVDRDYERAVERANQALAISPRDPLGLRIRSGALRRAGRFRESILSGEELRRLEPLHIQWLAELGNLYRGIRELERSSQMFEQYRTLSPRRNFATMKKLWRRLETHSPRRSRTDSWAIKIGRGQALRRRRSGSKWIRTAEPITAPDRGVTKAFRPLRIWPSRSPPSVGKRTLGLPQRKLAG